MSKATRGIAWIGLGLVLAGLIGVAFEPSPYISQYTAENWRQLHALSLTGMWLLIATGVYELATCWYAEFFVTRVQEVVGRGA